MPVILKRYILLIFMLPLVIACATFKVQQRTEAQRDFPNGSKKLSHTVFLVGGAGHLALKGNNTLLDTLEWQLKAHQGKGTLLYLGDNIGPSKENWETDKKLLARQYELAKDFMGEVVFLPGNNEWKSKDAVTIEKMEKYLDELPTETDLVRPKNVCPLEYQQINDDLAVIYIDSKWFISDWSKVEGINKKCTDIVTRMRFAEELEGMINDAQGKNIIIAMHHPIFSNGFHAGYKSFKDHMRPLPIVGSIVHGFGDLGAFSPDKLLSRRYHYLRVLVSSLAKDSDRVTVVSAHEESLQYLTGGDIRQVIAGSLAKATATKRTSATIKTLGGELPFKGEFTYGAPGFSKMVYYADGSAQLYFYTKEGSYGPFELLKSFASVLKEYPEHLAQKDTLVSVYGPDYQAKRSRAYEWLWGKRYRRYFNLPVCAKATYLDTLYGGLRFRKEGGGHQSYSLRLVDSLNKQFAMRSLQKDPLKYLKFSVRGVAYAEEDYAGTVPEELISDFFSTAHPFMQMVINPLAKAVDVNHANTELFFVPPQKTLQGRNAAFGNKLYYIEPRPSDEQYNYKGYRRTIDEDGAIVDFESTTDMLEKIKGDESYTVDQQAYVRARIFDMLIGDWDRHQDQWRWAAYEKNNGIKEFMPVPRDRDNAFPKFDGAAIEVIKWFVPITRQWQSYGPEIRNTKWLNYNGSRLDRTLLTDYDAAGWVREARYIQENLLPKDIDEAFLRLPAAMRDSTATAIKKSLKTRLGTLDEYAREYGSYLEKRVVIHGTEKDDGIYITRKADGSTEVILERLLSNEADERFYARRFHEDKTQELWVYGLGDNDNFELGGTGKSKIRIRLIGGYGKDDYDISNTHNLKVYDWKHEKHEFEQEGIPKQLTNNYPTNTFHWRYFKPNRNILVPNAGFRTDDGVFLGVRNTYKYNGFNGNPFRQKHTIKANYYFGFQAAELDYNGIFANIMPKWNVEVEGYASSNRYVRNFYGFGNDTPNLEDTLSRDFYRARTQKARLGAGLAYHTLRVKGIYETYDVEERSTRFLSTANVAAAVFDRQHYVGTESSVYYYNDDADDFPTKGLYLGLTAGYKWNTAIQENHFGYFSLNARVVQKLDAEGRIVLGTEAEYKTNFGGDYFFYHAPALGGNNGLRGFRDERFTGRSYFYQSSDLRFLIKRYITPLAPMSAGIYLGFDYGRVWQPGEQRDNWHTSQGIGLWAGIGKYLALNVGFFNSRENNLFQVGFGFGF